MVEAPSPQRGDNTFVSSFRLGWRFPRVLSSARHMVHAGSSAPSAGVGAGRTLPGLAPHSPGTLGDHGTSVPSVPQALEVAALQLLWLLRDPSALL